MNGLTAKIIAQIKNSCKEVSFDSPQVDQSVNMSPLRVENNIITHFKNIDFFSSDEPDR